MPSELVELRLKNFKSVQDAKISLTPLTLLVGRNGSGKSNIWMPWRSLLRWQPVRTYVTP